MYTPLQYDILRMLVCSPIIDKLILGILGYYWYVFAQVKV